MPNATQRQTARSRHAERQTTGQPQGASKTAGTTTGEPAEPQPKADPKPAKPEARIDLGDRPVIYYFPQATLSDGTVTQCSHSRYGHESSESAAKCIRALVAQHGHRAAGS